MSASADLVERAHARPRRFAPGGTAGHPAGEGGDPLGHPSSDRRYTAPRRIARAVVRVVSWLVVTLVLVLASLSVGLNLAAQRAHDGQYTVLGHPVMSVLSGSMTPTIRTGDLVIDDPVTPAQAASLHVGQVITFSSPTDHRDFFTHRIVAVLHGRGGAVSYRTKGDANDAPDALPVPSSAVVGVYRAKVPYGGYLLSALHKPAVLALLVLSLLLALAASAFFRLAKASGPRGGRRAGVPNRAGVATSRAQLVLAPVRVPSGRGSHHPVSTTYSIDRENP